MSGITFCSVCGKQRMEVNTIEIEGRTVCALCKPLVLQQLQEGVLPENDETQPIEIPDTLLRVRDITLISWWVLQDCWMAVLVIALLTTMPAEQISSLASEVTEPFLAALSAVLLPLTLILVGTVGNVAIIKLTSAKIEGQRLSAGQALQHAISLLIPGVWTGVLQTLIVVFFYVLLIVPGIIWTVYYYFALCVVSLREQSGMQALRYSKGLVQGMWWPITFRLIGITFIGLIPPVTQEVAEVVWPDLKATKFAMGILTGTWTTFTNIFATVLFLNLEKVNTYRRPIPASLGTT